MKKIFVVDDDKSIRWVLEKALTKNNYKVFVYDDPKAMILDIENFKPDVIISDIRMPGMSGIDMLEKIKREYPKIPIIIMTAFSDLETTVNSLKKGAYDYITKPFDINETVKLIEKASNNLRQAYSQDKIKYTKDVSKIIGMSESMQVIYKSIGKIAKTDVGVLILGKTGTGKELIAKQKGWWLDGKLGVVIDGTGRDLEKTAKIRQEMIDQGYGTMMLYVNTKLDVAQGGNKASKFIILNPQNIEMAQDVVIEALEVELGREPTIEEIQKHKHVLTPGRYVGIPDEEDDLEGEERFNNLFYQDDRLDDINEDDQDVLLNDDANDLLLQQELEDEVAVI